MNTNTFIDALGGVSDSYIISAWERLAPEEARPARTQTARRPAVRRALIGIAAALAILIASFSAAMALSDSFRGAVFSIFRIGTVETLPEETGALPQPGGLTEFADADIDDAVTVRYYTVNGVTNIIDGLIYSAPYGEDNGVFSELRADGLHKLDTELVEFSYSFRGTDFDISFSYAVCDGAAHFRGHQKHMNENPYKYGWDIRSAGGEDRAWLLLPYETRGDYGVYPLLLDLNTLETSDVFYGLPLDGLIPYNWQFLEEGRRALLCAFVEDYERGFWLCDAADGTMTDISELVGRPVSECWLADDSLICRASSENGVDVLRYDTDSGKTAVLVQDVPLSQIGGAGLINIQYYGAPGRHALIAGEDGSAALIDLLDGSAMSLDGLEYDSSLLTSESPDGTRILFARRETGVINSSAMYELGVLDTRTGTLTTLQRENCPVRAENPCGWLCGGELCVYAEVPEGDGGYCLYVYDFIS